MRIKISQLRAIIREAIEENLQEGKKLDRDGDKDKDFADVMMARMIAGGLADDEAYEKSRKFNELDGDEDVDEGST